MFGMTNGSALFAEHLWYSNSPIPTSGVPVMCTRTLRIRRRGPRLGRLTGEARVARTCRGAIEALASWRWRSGARRQRPRRRGRWPRPTPGARCCRSKARNPSSGCMQTVSLSTLSLSGSENAVRARVYAGDGGLMIRVFLAGRNTSAVRTRSARLRRSAGLMGRRERRCHRVGCGPRTPNATWPSNG